MTLISAVYWETWSQDMVFFVLQGNAFFEWMSSQFKIRPKCTVSPEPDGSRKAKLLLLYYWTFYIRCKATQLDRRSYLLLVHTV